MPQQPHTKSGRKKAGFSLLLLLLLLLSLSAGLLSIAAADHIPSVGGEPTVGSHLAFTDPASSFPVVYLPTVDLLSALEAEGILSHLSEVERNYLISSAEYLFSYHPQLPENAVRIYRRTSNSVLVSASTHSYTAKNGMSVTLAPISLLTDSGETADLSSGSVYLAAPEDKELSFTLTYGVSLTFTPALIDRIQNAAYTVGADAIEREALYDAAFAAYEKENEDYRTYIAALRTYEAERARYLDYLEEKESYEQASARYAVYTEAMKLYAEENEKYLAYLAAVEDYKKAESALETEMREKEEAFLAYQNYITYLSEKERCLSTLSVLDSVFLTSESGHQMYATLKGPTVQRVLDMEDDLVGYAGVSVEDIRNAGSATDKLIALLSSYKAKKTEKDRFDYYKQNYSALRDEFSLLYSSLYSLLSNVPVRGVLMSEGKYDRYCEFVAHLYLISSCLDDSFTLDPTWTIDKRPLSEALEKDYVRVDSNLSSPLSLTFPKEFPEAERPTLETVLPPYPETVYPPVKPEEVADPGAAPEEVKEPVKPDEVPLPGLPPVKPQISQEAKQLAAEIRSGNLKQHSPPSSPRAYTVTHTAPFFLPADQSAVLITFLNGDGSLLSRLHLNELSSLPTPKPPESPEFVYTFLGWKNANGETTDPSTLTESTTLYPIYSQETRYCTVKFVTPSGETLLSLPYGALPVYEGTPEKKETAGATYRFSGWDTPIAPVTHDTVYTATFDEIIRYYTVTWVLYGSETIRESYPYGEMPVCPRTPKAEVLEATHYYTFQGFSPSPIAVSGDITYTAAYGETVRLPARLDDQTEIALAVTTDPSGALLASLPENTVSLSLSRLFAECCERKLSLRLEYGDAEFFFPASLFLPERRDAGAQLELSSAPPSLSAPPLAFLSYRLTADTGDRLSLPGMQILLPSGEAERVIGCIGRETADGYEISNLKEGNFTLISGKKAVFTPEESEGLLLLYPLYEIKVELSEGNTAHGYLILSAPTGRPGETIALDARLMTGYRLDKIILTFTDPVSGETLPLSDNGEGGFTMPNGPVTVHASFAPISYKVSFYLDGILYEEREYLFGETLILPKEPEKASTEEKIYTFSGWSPAVMTTVLSDMTYTATFKVSAPASNQNFHRSPYTTYFPPYLIVTAVLLLAALIALPTVLVKQRKRARKK